MAQNRYLQNLLGINQGGTVYMDIIILFLRIIIYYHKV
jgi:hypothetical protein